MTVEEIKQQVTMRDLASKYGLKVRNNMCSCPFHGKDKHPSMRIFKDGYKCFACGNHGDIFAFVQEIEHCSFKDAFISLGGTYDEYGNKTQEMLVKNKFERNKRKTANLKNAESDFKLLLANTIKTCRNLADTNEPFSDAWCNAVNRLPWLLHVWEEKYIEGNEVNEIDVIRICRQTRCIKHPIK